LVQELVQGRLVGSQGTVSRGDGEPQETLQDGPEDHADPITCPPDVYGEQVTTKGHATAAHFGAKDFAVVDGFAYQ